MQLVFHGFFRQIVVNVLFAEVSMLKIGPRQLEYLKSNLGAHGPEMVK